MSKGTRRHEHMQGACTCACSTHGSRVGAGYGRRSRTPLASTEAQPQESGSASQRRYRTLSVNDTHCPVAVTSRYSYLNATSGSTRTTPLSLPNAPTIALPTTKSVTLEIQKDSSGPFCHIRVAGPEVACHSAWPCLHKSKFE